MAGKHKDRKGTDLAQVAALPYRVVDGEVFVLLLTSRETKRAVLPKGWPMKGLTDAEAAAVEAREEAGVVGRVAAKAVGRYSYWKRRDRDFRFVEVAVYPLKVSKQLEDWKEKGQRETSWMPVDVAAAMVDEPGLRTLIAEFRPKKAKPEKVETVLLDDRTTDCAPRL